MKKMKLFLTAMSIFILLAAGKKSHAQASNWILHSDNTGLEVYYQFQNCNGQESLLLKVVNKNTVPGTLQYSAYGIIPAYTVTLAASETLVGSCGIPGSLVTKVPPGLPSGSASLTLNITFSQNSN